MKPPAAALIAATLAASAPAPMDHQPNPAMATQKRLNTQLRITASQAAHIAALENQIDGLTAKLETERALLHALRSHPACE